MYSSPINNSEELRDRICNACKLLVIESKGKRKKEILQRKSSNRKKIKLLSNSTKNQNKFYSLLSLSVIQSKLFFSFFFFARSKFSWEYEKILFLSYFGHCRQRSKFNEDYKRIYFLTA